MAWYNSMNDFKDAIGGIANVAAMLPGPIGTAGKIISVIGAATSKKSNPADAANAASQAGADAQMAYQQQALQQYQDLMNRSLAVDTADKQMAYDVNRGVYKSNQANMLPYQTASMSALQALPQLQQLLGLDAYEVGKNITQYTPPEMNYADLYQQSQAKMFPTEDATVVNAPGSATSPNPSSSGTNTELPPGIRLNQVVGGTAAEQVAANATGTTTTTALTPYTGKAYDLENSPLFKWQKKIADEGLTNQLASQGLSGGTYAQRELTRSNQGLAAAERERVVNNLQGMVNTGMSGSGLGQTNFTTPQSTNISNTLNNGATNIASMYGNMGSIQGQLGNQLATNSIAGANANASTNNGWQTAAELAASYGWLGTKTAKPFTTTIGPNDVAVPTKWYNL